MIVEIPVSVGDLIDRITILEIKVRRLADPAKRQNAQRELALLEGRRDALGLALEPLQPAIVELRAVNEALWEVEDQLRDCEREGRFDARFVELARQVYFTNDRRFALKAEIDRLTGSEIREQKSYAEYRREDESGGPGPRGSTSSQ